MSTCSAFAHEIRTLDGSRPPALCSSPRCPERAAFVARYSYLMRRIGNPIDQVGQADRKMQLCDAHARKFCLRWKLELPAPVARVRLVIAEASIALSGDAEIDRQNVQTILGLQVFRRALRKAFGGGE